MKKLVLFLDSGDTFVDESTQIWSEEGIVTHTDLFPGAAELLRKWKREGYLTIMVADGRTQSFRNVYEEHGVSDCFAARAVSEEVGVDKPDGRMFSTAMELGHLTEADKGRIVMVGNNLLCDIVGANRAGIASILLTISGRRRITPETAEETPTFAVRDYAELDALIERLEAKLENGESIR